MEKKKKPTRRRFDEDYKSAAVQLLLNGESISSVSKNLGVSENILYRWKEKALEKEKTTPEDQANRAELEALKRKVKDIEMERDILKKALLIFGRST